jgi:hypothetical protein
LLLVQVEVEQNLEDELHRWYEEEHIAERLSVPGFLRVRRYQSVGQDRKFLALYDLERPEVLDTPAYLHWKTSGVTPWTRRMESNFQSFTRQSYQLISDRKR